MDRIIRFYGDVLGFKTGYRPPFSVPGCWLYLEENALIHVVQIDVPAKNDDPSVNHFAFFGSGLKNFLEHLRKLDVPYNVRVAPEIERHQVEVFDPDGNMFEVLFEGNEADQYGNGDFGVGNASATCLQLHCLHSTGRPC